MQTKILAISLLAGLGLWSGTPAWTPTQAPQDDRHSYSVRTLRGRHGFTYDGTWIGTGPVASSGRIDFDGRGNCHASYTTSVNGIAFRGTWVGTYTVNDDGTGNIMIQLPHLNRVARGSFVILDRGNASYFTATDNGFAVTGRTERM